MKYILIFLSICFLLGCKHELKETSPAKVDSINKGYYWIGDTLYLKAGQKNIDGAGFNDGRYDTASNRIIMGWDGSKWIKVDYVITQGETLMLPTCYTTEESWEKAKKNGFRDTIDTASRDTLILLTSGQSPSKGYSDTHIKPIK